jgi:heavy metal sensor kinase
VLVTAFQWNTLMKRLKTLRFRFALWTSGLVLVVLVVFGVYVYASMASRLSSAIDDSLALSASQVSAGLNVENGKLILPDSLAEDSENADLRGSGFTIRILSPQGQTLSQFGPFHGLPASLSQSLATFTDPATNTSIRLYNHPVYDNNQLVAVVQVAQSRQDMQETLQRLLVTLLVSAPVLLLIAGSGGYLLAARALTPIDQITSTARRISAEDLSARLNMPVTDDEVGRLIQTFDDMLARLDDSFQRERQFTDDASHELRTPLAAMQAILGMIRQQRRTPEEYELALDDLVEETDRLHTLVETLLQLARDNRQTRLPRQSVNLSTLLTDVSDSMRPLAEARHLSLVCEIPENLTILGDSDDLIRLFVNLLDNAIKYTEHGAITLRAAKEEKNIVVTVADTGNGIPPEDLSHIFDRFFRMEKSRHASGTGLGLAIAREIVQSHGGVIQADSRMSQGTTFTLRFPSAPSPVTSQA